MGVKEEGLVEAEGPLPDLAQEHPVGEFVGGKLHRFPGEFLGEGKGHRFVHSLFEIPENGGPEVLDATRPGDPVLANLELDLVSQGVGESETFVGIRLKGLFPEARVPGAGIDFLENE